MTEEARDELAQKIIDGLPPVRSRRQNGMVYGLFAAVVLVLIATVVFALIASSANSKASQARAFGAQDHQDALALAKQVQQLGAAPVVTPSALPTPRTGPQGPGPSDIQVALAVSLYCRAVHCGSGPTAAQVAQAVATYCDSRGQCRGPAGKTGAAGVGKTGKPGANGKPGPSGAPGQNATSDEIAAAVSSYCGSHNGCAGAPGKDGANGASGAPGSSGAAGAAGPPPQSFSWTFVVPGNGLTASDTTYQTTCNYGGTAYQCATVKQGG